MMWNMDPWGDPTMGGMLAQNQAPARQQRQPMPMQRHTPARPAPAGPGQRPLSVGQLVGVSPAGCVAIPNLPAATVTTIKDDPDRLVAGIWKITGQQRAGGVLNLSLQLPSVVTLDKSTLQCEASPVNLTRTLRGPDLATLLHRAAQDWCNTF